MWTRCSSYMWIHKTSSAENSSDEVTSYLFLLWYVMIDVSDYHTTSPVVTWSWLLRSPSSVTAACTLFTRAAGRAEQLPRSESTSSLRYQCSCTVLPIRLSLWVSRPPSRQWCEEPRDHRSTGLSAASTRSTLATSTSSPMLKTAESNWELSQFQQPMLVCGVNARHQVRLAKQSVERPSCQVGVSAS